MKIQEQQLEKLVQKIALCESKTKRKQLAAKFFSLNSEHEMGLASLLSEFQKGSLEERRRLLPFLTNYCGILVRVSALQQLFGDRKGAPAKLLILKQLSSVAISLTTWFDELAEDERYRKIVERVASKSIVWPLSASTSSHLGAKHVLKKLRAIALGREADLNIGKNARWSHKNVIGSVAADLQNTLHFNREWPVLGGYTRAFVIWPDSSEVFKLSDAPKWLARNRNLPAFSKATAEQWLNVAYEILEYYSICLENVPELQKYGSKSIRKKIEPYGIEADVTPGKTPGEYRKTIRTALLRTFKSMAP